MSEDNKLNNLDNNNQQNNHYKSNDSSSYYIDNSNLRKIPHQRRKKGIFSYFIVALIAAIIGGMISVYIAPIYIYDKILPMPEMFKQPSNNYNDIQIKTSEEMTNVSAVSQKAIKSVVGITTIETQVDLFWGKREQQGLGSGVIVDSNGYILTNSHVIGNGKADKITVQFEDGTKKDGKVLWYEPALDLAILKVEATNLPVADLGNSDDLIIGELAVAIGNPLGLQFQRTVTSGIISGLERTIRVDANTVMEDLIQTDASINPGNSGGPLLNSEGEVIGINTAKIQSAEGLGFSIPINIAKPIINQVIKEGKFKSVYIGIVGVEVEKYEKALGVDLKEDKGVIIIEVTEASPAFKANLKSGDIIKSLDDNEVKDMNSLRKLLYNYKEGDKSKMTIIRNGVEKNIEIVFEEAPENY